MEADAAGVAYDDGADLQELEADSVRLSPGNAESGFGGNLS